MRTSTVLKAAGGVLGLSSLLFAIPGQASASNYCGDSGGDEYAHCLIATYDQKGYAYDQTSGSGTPEPGAVLVHVKIRNEHTHPVELKSYNSHGALVDDHSEKVDGNDMDNPNGLNGWFDPAKVTKVEVTLSGRSTVSNPTDTNHCYYEDKHGNLQEATDRPCNSN
jgi:hypothetical protein